MKKQLLVKNRTADETALVRKYNRRTENVPVLFKYHSRKNDEIRITPVDDDTELAKAKMLQSFGTTSDELQNYFMQQIRLVFSESASSTEGDKLIASFCKGITILHELKPRDVIEVMLIIQMIGVHNLAIATLSRALLPSQAAESAEAYIQQTTKMLRTFAQQMDALKNYRRTGQQKVIVEHVNVNQGGQAVVGSITQGGEE